MRINVEAFQTGRPGYESLLRCYWVPLAGWKSYLTKLPIVRKVSAGINIAPRWIFIDLRSQIPPGASSVPSSKILATCAHIYTLWEWWELCKLDGA